MTERAKTIKHSSEHGKIATLKVSNIFHKIRTIKPKGNVARCGALGTRHCLPIQQKKWYYRAWIHPKALREQLRLESQGSESQFRCEAFWCGMMGSCFEF